MRGSFGNGKEIKVGVNPDLLGRMIPRGRDN